LGKRLRQRSVFLVAALASLLLVIAGTAFVLWSNATRSQERVATLQTTYSETAAALADIRANVYLAAILTRDYLLDPDPSHARPYIDQFDAIRSGTERDLATIEKSGLDESQRLAVKKLREGLGLYWNSTQTVLDWTPEEKRAQRLDMLRNRVRRREEIFALAGDIERLVGANFQHQRSRITSADQDLRTSLGLTTLLFLVAGFAISGATLTRMRTLERQSQAAESELRRLSAQIRTAHEEERKYLSRELHDQVGQMLTGLRMELGGIARLQGGADIDLSLRLAGAKGTVEEILRIVRNIAMLPRPSMLDDLGLAPALAWLIQDVSKSSGLQIESTIAPDADRVPDQYRTCIYRVVQEALTNTVRHSRARRVNVTIKREGPCLVGTVTDDGRGFDRLPPGLEKGLGLLGMEERVRELGGTIRVESSSLGTSIELRIPVAEWEGTVA
jgi:signal transduction histidine kinase